MTIKLHRQIDTFDIASLPQLVMVTVMWVMVMPPALTLLAVSSGLQKNKTGMSQ